MSSPQSLPIPVTISPSTLSGYTKITEFTVFPNLTGTGTGDIARNFYKDLSETTLYIDFGDGSTTHVLSSLSATHIYDYPGQYDIKMYFYDNEGTTYLNTLNPQLSVYNFVTTNIFAETAGSQILAGVLDDRWNAITLEVSASWQDYTSAGNSILLTASGSETEPFHTGYKFAHLLPFHAFYEKDTGGNFVRIESTSIDLEPRYFFLSAGIPTLTATDISGAELLGATGTKTLYYFDDLPGNPNVRVSLDLSNHLGVMQYYDGRTLDTNTSDKTFFEIPTMTLPITSVFTEPATITFTSTGLKDMALSPYKRQGDKFQVFASVADVSGNPLKYYSQILSATTIADNTGYINFYRGTESFNANVSSLSTDYLPYANGQTSLSSFMYAVINPVSAGTHNLSASISVPFQGGTKTLTAVSAIDVFELSGRYPLFKVNEDFDATETMKSYRFQEFLLQYPQFFDEVLGAIVGTLSSGADTLGKLTYEKTANFVSNVADPDLSNTDRIDQFNRLLCQTDVGLNLQFPPGLKRLFDLFSIKQSRLIGQPEQFTESFDCNFDSDTSLGKNIDLQNQISVLTYEVSAGTTFVVRQKFNNEYFKITPMTIIGRDVWGNSSSLSANELTAYPLSTFNNHSRWGWSLDASLTALDLNLAYEFYPYVSYTSNTLKNNTIDYQNSYTATASSLSTLNDWDNRGGIKYENLDRQIREGLAL